MISKTLKQARTATLKFVITMVSLVLLLAGMLVTSQSAWSVESIHSTIADSSTLNWKPLAGIPEGAKVAVLTGNPATSASEVVISLPAGYLFPHHFHTSPEILFWSKGEFTYIADDGTKQYLQPDTYLNLPSGTKHSVVCGQEPCLVYARYDQPFDLLLSPASKNDP